ncbi:MAG: DNA mismatch repair endonuclease MutL [Chloroflexota bacterium]|nr:DNA mismatch repair endonuclease MutL [Chloroflexota bacterium]
MPIKVLAPDVTSRIAAGEVIERPASVTKELIENSLDAGASQITVEAQGGGAELIKVSDNGEGIPVAEAELAFYRYSTSKITNLDDLERISSMGFRGEALPSIAAVAEVEIFTKAISENIGSFLYLKDGKVVRQESRSRSQGTTISVSHLFQQFPARRKFLKSESTESSHITHVVNQYALAFPGVKFALFLDHRLNLQTEGDGDLRQVMSKVYGLEVAQEMLDVVGRDALLEVIGLTSPLSLVRSNRSYLSLFVNRRWVYSPLLARAIGQAYHGLLMVGRYPITVINISLPAQEVDVNVHPAKTQVKFHHEQIIFSDVEKAIKGALERTPVAKLKAVASQDIAWQWSNLEVKDREPVFAAPLLPLKLPVLRVLGQIASTYIIAEGPDGLYIIDQHAAHERILYDKIMAQWLQREVEVQGLLQPVTVELSLKDEEILRANMENLTQFGFVVESFGNRNYLIRSVPLLLGETKITAAIDLLLDTLSNKEDSVPWEEKVAQSLACHSAIKAGQQLSSDEIRELLRQMEQTQQPRTCPHGRPTVIHINSYQLEKDFGRRG